MTLPSGFIHGDSTKLYESFNTIYQIKLTDLGFKRKKIFESFKNLENMSINITGILVNACEGLIHGEGKVAVFWLAILSNSFSKLLKW